MYKKERRKQGENRALAPRVEKYTALLQSTLPMDSQTDTYRALARAHPTPGLAFSCTFIIFFLSLVLSAHSFYCRGVSTMTRTLTILLNRSSSSSRFANDRDYSNARTKFFFVSGSVFCLQRSIFFVDSLSIQRYTVEEKNTGKLSGREEDIQVLFYGIVKFYGSFGPAV